MQKPNVINEPDPEDFDEDEMDAGLQATDAPDTSPADKIEFHVQMKDYQLRQLEHFIVDTAARVLVGKLGDAKLAKMIEERAIAMLNDKINERLAQVTAEIINQPLTPAMFAKSEPVTMGEFVGLAARDFLEAPVDREGKLARDNWSMKYGKRIDWIVARAVDGKLKNEIEKATGETIAKVQLAIRAHHDQHLAAERKRLAEALAKITGENA